MSAPRVVSVGSFSAIRPSLDGSEAAARPEGGRVVIGGDDPERWAGVPGSTSADSGGNLSRIDGPEPDVQMTCSKEWSNPRPRQPGGLRQCRGS